MVTVATLNWPCTDWCSPQEYSKSCLVDCHIHAGERSHASNQESLDWLDFMYGIFLIFVEMRYYRSINWSWVGLSLTLDSWRQGLM